MQRLARLFQPVRRDLRSNGVLEDLSRTAIDRTEPLEMYGFLIQGGTYIASVHIRIEEII